MIAYLCDELVERQRTLIAVRKRLDFHLSLRLEIWPDEHNPRRTCVPRRLELLA